MKTFAFAAAIAAAGVLASVASAEAASLSEQVQGTSWHLVSLTATPPKGSPMQPYGPNPTGYMMLDRTGHFIAVTGKPDVPKFASDNLMKATDPEQLAAYRGTLVDWGAYKVDEKSHTLIFHVTGANFPNWIGTDIHRATALTGNRMTWANPSGAGKVPVVLIWERLR
jgi:Lipocalin-like domain